MSLEIHVGDRQAEVELINKEGNKVQITVDGKMYDVDVVMVENGVYSIIHNNKSYNIELVKGDTSKNYNVNTLYNSISLEIVDSQAKYIKRRQKDDIDESQDKIFSPMPGKVVKIPVNKGDQVVAGTTVIIVEAMKMQSEYKVKRDSIIKDILVKEGDTVDGNQTLIVLE